MSASMLKIWNAALSTIGQSGNISDPNETTVVAKNCREFYPIALCEILEDHLWSFAASRSMLALIKKDTFGWQYAYAAPSNAVKIFAVGLPRDMKLTHKSEVPFVVESDAFTGDRIIYCDVPSAACLYTRSIEPTETGNFSPKFTNALVMLLAAYLSGVTLRGTEGINLKNSLLQMYSVLLGQAAKSDSDQQQGAMEYIAPWVLARR